MKAENNCHFICCFPISGGFYTVLIKPGLRLVSLNTVYYYINDILTANMSDPAGQFEWMDGVLTNASMAKEKARTLKLPLSTKFLRVLITVFGYYW